MYLVPQNVNVRTPNMIVTWMYNDPMGIFITFQTNILIIRLKHHNFLKNVLTFFLNVAYINTKIPNQLIKVRGPFVQTLCIEKDSYMDAI